MRKSLKRCESCGKYFVSTEKKEKYYCSTECEEVYYRCTVCGDYYKVEDPDNTDPATYICSKMCEKKHKIKLPKKTKKTDLSDLNVNHIDIDDIHI